MIKRKNYYWAPEKLEHTADGGGGVVEGGQYEMQSTGDVEKLKRIQSQLICVGWNSYTPQHKYYFDSGAQTHKILDMAT